MEKVIVIVGQTASGKTSLSLKLANFLNTEIINGDALQVYKELNIVTDKIKDKQGITHHLLDIKSINDFYSVSEYQKDVREKIKEVNEKGMIPILVGGTGLYIKAALYDYDFKEETNTNFSIEEKYKDYSNEALYDLLKSIDPKSIENIHQNNRRRVLRAIAIYETTGIRKSEAIEAQEHKMLYDVLMIGLTMDKDIANKKMDDRIEAMFSEGLVDEIANNKTSSTASKAIGYKEVCDYLNGNTSLEEAKELMKIHTHQYAKRQRTWFNNQFNVNWIEVNENTFGNAKELIRRFIDEKK